MKSANRFHVAKNYSFGPAWEVVQDGMGVIACAHNREDAELFAEGAITLGELNARNDAAERKMNQ